MSKQILKLSHSARQKWTNCGYSYYLHYVKKLRSVTFSSNLTFGGAVDNALNEMLENKDNPKALDMALAAFDRSFEQGQNSQYEMVDMPLNPNIEYGRYDFDSDLLEKSDWAELFKYNPNFFDMKKDIESKIYPKEDENGIKADPIPWTQISEDDRMVYNYAIWKCLSRKGHILITQYYNDILPLIKTTLATQYNITLADEEGNELPGVVDLIAEVHGKALGLDYDPVVLIDNKTAAQPYKSDSVITSDQLAQYAATLNILADDPEHEWNHKIDLSAFAVMIKKLEKNITKTCKECGHVSSGTHKTCDNIVTKLVESRGKKSEKEVRCNGSWDVVKEFSAKTQFVYDTISEQKQMEVLDNSTTVQTCIKMGLYPKNYGMCKNMFGRSCQYLDYCHKGSEEGLITVEKKNEK